MTREQLIYIDGNWYTKDAAKISVFDHGLLYGDGIFEGIRAYDGYVFKLDEHVDRLFDAARAISLTVPADKQEVKDVVIQACRKNGITDGYIRLVVTRGKGDLGLSPTKCPQASMICIAATIALYPPEFYDIGLKVVTAVQRRNKATIIDPQIKSLNYLNNVLARIEADKQGAPEALMLTEEGLVAECTGDNIFIIKNNVIWTPPTYLGILDGITRSTVIALAKERGYEVTERPFTLYNVYSADEIFLTGTAAEIIAVTLVDDRVIGTGKAGPVTAELLKAFHAYTKGQGAKI